jgi:hypothetical protein
MVYSSEEVEVIWIVQLICGSISVMCCLFISLCYVFFPYLRGYEFRLILYITLSDMITSIMYIVPSSTNDDICSFQGTILSFTENLRLSFFLHMSIYLHLTMKSYEDKFKEYEKLFIFLVFIISSILAVLPLITSSYGNANGLCWIRVNRDNYLSATLLRFGIFYIPLWIVIFYTNWVYYLMIKNIKNLRSSSIVSRNFAKSATRKLWLYPVILTVGWLPDSTYRIIEAFDTEFQNLFLSCLSLGLVAGLGFFNGLVYGLTPEVKHVLLRSCLRKNNASFITESSVERLNQASIN